MKELYFNTYFRRSLMAIVLILCGVGTTWADFTPTAGKPYALKAVKQASKGDITDDLYLDLGHTNTSNGCFTIYDWSETCILNFEESTTNSGYYAIKSTAGYATAVADHTWHTTVSDSYDASYADWLFIGNEDDTYYIKSIKYKDVDKYLGSSNIVSNSHVTYDKLATGTNAAVISWQLYSVYKVSITGNPSTATATIGGTEYSDGDYYFTTSETVSASSITPTEINDYMHLVTVDNSNGRITINYYSSAVNTPGTYYILSNYSGLNSGTHEGEHVAISDVGKEYVMWYPISGQSTENLWKIEKNGSGYTFQNYSSGKYIKSPKTSKSDCPLTDAKDDATVFTLSKLSSGGFLISDGTYYLHARGLTEYCTKGTYQDDAKHQIMTATTKTSKSPSDWGFYDASNLTIYRVNIKTPTGYTGDAPELKYTGDNLFPDETVTKKNGETLFINSKTVPTTDQFTYEEISGLTSTIVIENGEITITYISHTTPTSISSIGNTVLLGTTWTFEYTLSPTPCYDDVTFESNNPTVATVDAATGVVTGVSLGTATITLTAHDDNGNVACTATAVINVTDKRVIFLNSLGTTSNGGDSEDTTAGLTFGLAQGTTCGTHSVGLGNDDNDGLTPERPVATWKEAYARLKTADEGGTWDNQAIVVMGYNDNSYFHVGDQSGKTKDMTVATKPVHITGMWDGVDYLGEIGRCYTGTSGQDYNGIPINADHKFSHLKLSNQSTNQKHYFIFYAHYHNLYMGEGLHMIGMPMGAVGTLGGVSGCITTNAHIFGGYYFPSYIPSSATNEYVTKATQDRKDINPKPEGFTITVRSGYWGVVSVGGRGEKDLIVGSPEAPLKGHIVIDIDHENSNTSATEKEAVKNKVCNYDVGCVLAGNHAGTMYADSQIDIIEGKVSRVVNGTLGNVQTETGANKYTKTSGGVTTNIPWDSFFGRAVVNVTPRNGDDSKVKITEFYCGGLGRSNVTKGPEAQTYFYGHSIVNINGGTFENAVFGSGAGGVNGVGAQSNWDATNNTFLTSSDGTPLHCKDKLLPYWVDESKNVNNRNVLYGPDKGNLVDITVKNFADDGTYTTETFNIRDTKSIITINGGVFGTATKSASIYAGGWGEVNSDLINYKTYCPSTLSGDIFGATMDGICSQLTINGGTIYGDVYGAGKGSTTYYDYYNSLDTKASPTGLHAATEFLHMGSIVGSTSVTISGNTIIHGNVFGGGDGGELVGNSHVKISGPVQVDENVYGGGNMATVGGTTTVQIGEKCE